MNYLYHGVPKHLEGNILYPLNILKDKLPNVYEKEASKYVGRERVKENRIPAFNCLWNDVLHFAAVHPAELKKALVEAGMDESKTLSFYQLDPGILNPEDCIVYLNDKKSEGEKRKAISEEDFTTYNLEDISKYSALKQETKDYYKEQLAQGIKPLMFLFVPHILYRGSVDISRVPIIQV